MRLVIQRVHSASVIIDNTEYSKIYSGLLCFVGFCDTDTDDDYMWAVNKLLNLKLFENQESIKDIQGQLLVVSQFTLFASIKKGTKPSWSRAAKPDLAKKMYDRFISICNANMSCGVQTGVFGAHMQINSINNGPMTIIIDTQNKE